MKEDELERAVAELEEYRARLKHYEMDFHPQSLTKTLLR